MYLHSGLDSDHQSGCCRLDCRFRPLGVDIKCGIPLFHRQLGKCASAHAVNGGARPSLSPDWRRNYNLPGIFPPSVLPDLQYLTRNFDSFSFESSVWLLSNRQTLLVIVLGLGCLTTFSFDVGMSVVISRALSVATFTKYTPEVIALFSTGAGSEEIYMLDKMDVTDQRL